MAGDHGGGRLLPSRRPAVRRLHRISAAAFRACGSTTPLQLQVVLVEQDDGVSDFLAANFGCRVAPSDSGIAVGDCLQVKGEYVGEPPRLVASILCSCGDGHDDDKGDHDGDEGGSACWDRLTGPVTEVDVAGRAVAIMGAWVNVVDEDFDLEAVEVGDRLQANVQVVEDETGHHLEACRLHRFHGHFDRLRGVVQELIRDDDGAVIGVVVLDTRVDVTGAHHDCDD